MYNLACETPTRWSPLTGAELRAGRAGGSCSQTAAERWLQDAEERLSTHLDMLRARDMKMSYSTSGAQMLDMMQKVRDYNYVLMCFSSFAFVFLFCFVFFVMCTHV